MHETVSDQRSQDPERTAGAVADEDAAPPDLAGDADRALLHNVRPRAWRNPTPSGRYDLVVVGGGTAGLVAAAGGAGLGARVALVERDRFGGPAADGPGDFGTAMERMRRLRAELSRHDGAERFRSLGVAAPVAPDGVMRAMGATPAAAPTGAGP
jgi:NADPH-dependent 2,4-dienoyl-CoA reductase/sulfur reductase-like enzyme